MYSRMLFRSLRNYKVNVVVKFLIMSDFMIWGSVNLCSPIFAIFLTKNIHGASLETVGIASAIYFITKSVVEAPVGMYIDKTKTEMDDLLTALSGTILTGVCYFSYTLIDTVHELYFVQFLLGIGAAISFPGWYSIFTRHVDKGKEGFEWSMYDVVMGIGMASTAALGGFIAEIYGFETLFYLAAIITMAGSLSLLFIKDKIYTSHDHK